MFSNLVAAVSGYISIPTRPSAHELREFGPGSSEHEQGIDRISVPRTKQTKRTYVKRGLLLSGAFVGGLVASHAINRSPIVNPDDFECIPRYPGLDGIDPQPSNHVLSDSGIFSSDPALIGKINRAEKYLITSADAQNQFENISPGKMPIPVYLHMGDDSFQSKGAVHWNPDIIGESKTHEFDATSTDCGTRSPALILAHEAKHAVWARSNPIGHALLQKLNGYPFYDNLEEARVVLAINRIAADLNESQRATHHGRYQAQAKDVTDANGQICPGGEIRSEQSALERGWHEGRESEQLFSAHTSDASIWAILRLHMREIPHSLIVQVRDLLNERGNVILRLNEAISRRNTSDIDFKQILLPHIEKAINVATQFHGIAVSAPVQERSFMIHA
jgi:hypothetical protein